MQFYSSTPLIACESFIRSTSHLDSKGLCVAWHYPRIDGLNGLRPTLRVGALHLNPRPRSALLLLRPLSVGRFASLRFRPKNMAHHIFQPESELQNIPEAAPEASPSFSVSEKLARYGSSALSGVEHLTLLVGKESVALALIRHFGSLKGFGSRFLPGTTAIPSTA